MPLKKAPGKKAAKKPVQKHLAVGPKRGKRTLGLVRRRRRAKVSVELGKRLGGRAEGDVHEALVHVYRTGGDGIVRSKVRKMAVKVFPPKLRPESILTLALFKGKMPVSIDALGNPERQFRAMQRIAELNRKRGLGLNLPFTIRKYSVKGEKKPRLIMTLLENAEPFDTFEERHFSDKSLLKELHRQLRHQENALRGIGYTAWIDSWLVAKDPGTGKVKVWIADFGRIEKLGRRDR